MRMKRFFIYASAVGLVAGVAYWLYKKEKSNNAAPRTVHSKVMPEHNPQEEAVSQDANAAEEVYQAKSESVQAIYERHSEASEIMKDAYRNIMEDFVEDYSVEKEEKGKDVVIDNESISVIKELDSISDELDDLLK